MKTQPTSTKEKTMETATAFAPLTGTDDPRVVAFLDAWHENGRPFFVQSYTALAAAGYYDSRTGEAKSAKEGRKYINLDHGSSGAFMVEKATGVLYTIKGYGRINRRHCLGNIEAVTAGYLEATAANRQCGLR